MLLKNCELVLQGLQVAAHITGIAILGDQLQCDFLTTTTDQDWNMWFLYTLWLIDRAPDLVVFAFKDSLFLGPHGMDHLQRFTQHAQALRGIWIRIAIRFVLMFIPASADAEV